MFGPENPRSRARNYTPRMAIDGYVATEFEPVLDEFSKNFDTRGEVGAAVCVYLEGEPVVDLWGGAADPHTEAPWQEDTLVLVYSATKGVTATCANLLMQNGLITPETKVADIWPEFAANGKAAITVAQVMSHQAGLPYVEGEFTLEESLDWQTMVDALAQQKPIWEPGTKHGYHMRTYGWLVGEVIRRADPQHRSVGTFWREEIADALGVDFWIGLPEELESRVAQLVPPKTDLRAALEVFGDDLLLARVLQPFVQVDSSLNRQHEGTGLGLPLVKAMMELHDGDVLLDSAPGVGTSVTLAFPPERIVVFTEAEMAVGE